MNNKPNSVNQPLTVDDIINEIKRKSSGGDYIYRGERKQHQRVSSALYREYDEIDIEGFDLTVAQKEVLKAAKKHVGEPPQDIFEDKANVRSIRRRFIQYPDYPERTTIAESDELEILTELQHFGGKTNLIDFTTDYLIAIYFACSGEPKVEGRVILLEKTAEIKNMVIRPYNPRHRVIAQKSVFLYPPKGFIDVHDENKVIIPFTLKQPLLTYLRQHHGISAETIYNDIHGFIKHQKNHKSAYIEFYLGLTYQNRGEKEECEEKRKELYNEAIRHYDISIEENPEYGSVYNHRGECWLHLRKWENARKDLTTASNMGSDIIFSFFYIYEGGVEDFNKKTGLEMPNDIAKMLEG